MFKNSVNRSITSLLCNAKNRSELVSLFAQYKPELLSNQFTDKVGDRVTGSMPHQDGNIPSASKQSEEMFAEAGKSWNLEKLFAELAKVKKSGIAETEKQFFRGLLCAKSPTEIADSPGMSANAVRVKFSREVYPPIRKLCGLSKTETLSWHQIPRVLETAGYSCQPQSIERENEVLKDEQLKVDGKWTLADGKCSYQGGIVSETDALSLYDFQDILEVVINM